VDRVRRWTICILPHDNYPPGRRAVAATLERYLIRGTSETIAALTFADIEIAHKVNIIWWPTSSI